jgi:hypothetical protein
MERSNNIKHDISLLKGFANTTPECAEEGTLIGQNGELYSVVDIDKYINYYTVEHLAVALSRSVRYLGNSQMTVAQHCVRGAEFFILMGDIDNAHNFLMHEVSEPFGISDISTPIKKMLGDKLKNMEFYIESELSKKFEFEYPFPKIIKQIDVNLAMDEMSMMKHENTKSRMEYTINFDYWDHKKSYEQFISTYNKIKIYKSYQSKDLIK